MHTVRRLRLAIPVHNNHPQPSKAVLTSRQKSTRSARVSPANPAVPHTPTWSVHALIAACPQPTLSAATMAKLHALSALVPPAEGTAAYVRMKGELEEMVRLVEGVRMVDVSAVGRERDVGKEGEEDIPDGRIWPEGEGMVLSSNTRDVEFPDPEVESGSTLLRHAAQTKDGFYVVEADRRKK
ncbi:hypothetical protein EW145_g769 [Phellinidium pouzarii]|uniref:Uncharacterized protein n=1 Tax=Phellinidium pouzarii TaxID=167371 RepID=A0A4S4LIV4_9AGAM|nr:hypothetical protein EW145_g769 [Phellinidium pouzarii]